MMKHAEEKLPYPQRYVMNSDSIGIEIVTLVDHSGDKPMKKKDSTPVLDDNGKQKIDHDADVFFHITP